MPSVTGIPLLCANETPSAAHSTADTTASDASSTRLRRLAHHHGPPGAPPPGTSGSVTPVIVIPVSLKARHPNQPGTARTRPPPAQVGRTERAAQTAPLPTHRTPRPPSAAAHILVPVGQRGPHRQPFPAKEPHL
ncbi:hypothetical protein GCM10009753_57330 [Streptantibioticus ferralitis]